MKYGRLKKKLTTTDIPFDQLLRGLMVLYDDPNVLDKKHIFNCDDVVPQYMSGYMLQATKPWSLIDDVLMPVNTGDHWIMVRLDIKKRSLVVYDSVRNDGHDEHVVEVLRCYSVILPFFMSSLGVWRGRKYRGPKSKISETDPIEIIWEPDLPMQVAS